MRRGRSESDNGSDNKHGRRAAKHSAGRKADLRLLIGGLAVVEAANKSLGRGVVKDKEIYLLDWEPIDLSFSVDRGYFKMKQVLSILQNLLNCWKFVKLLKNCIPIPILVAVMELPILISPPIPPANWRSPSYSLSTRIGSIWVSSLHYCKIVEFFWNKMCHTGAGTTKPSYITICLRLSNGARLSYLNLVHILRNFCPPKINEGANEGAN